MYTVSDLFAGIGGWGCGAMEAGCGVVFTADAAKHLIGLMQSNMPGVESHCVTLPCDDLKTWIPLDTSIIFASPPCQALSAARVGTTEEQRNCGLELVRWTLNLLLDTLPKQKGRKPFVFCCENVASAKLSKLLSDVKQQHADSFDYVTLQLRDFGVPTDRRRIIFGSRQLIARLVAATPVAAPSVFDVLGSEAVGCASHLKNTSSVMDESGVRVPSIRPLTCPGFTVCATHPLLLSDGTGKTVRCLNAREQARLMTFPDTWRLPERSRDSIHAVGNAVPPVFSRKVTEIAIKVLDDMASNELDVTQQAEAYVEEVAGEKRLLKMINRLKKRVKRLEHQAGR
jgi:site-specific DNA-cytosine methylase